MLIDHPWLERFAWSSASCAAVASVFCFNFDNVLKSVDRQDYLDYSGWSKDCNWLRNSSSVYIIHADECLVAELRSCQSKVNRVWTMLANWWSNLDVVQLSLIFWLDFTFGLIRSLLNNIVQWTVFFNGFGSLWLAPAWNALMHRIIAHKAMNNQ